MFGSHYDMWGDAGSMALPVKLALGDLALCTTPSPEKIKSWNLPKNSAYILVGTRGGDCSFVKKVRTAQQIGASAVLIADTVNNHLPHTMANDGCTSPLSLKTKQFSELLLLTICHSLFCVSYFVYSRSRYLHPVDAHQQEHLD
ncbi:MAG: hypothetical protein SGARI_008048 [Bacillariaceae sp.]